MSFVYNDQLNVFGLKLCKQVVFIRASAEGVKIRDNNIGFEQIVTRHTAYWCVLSIEGQNIRWFASRN